MNNISTINILGGGTPNDSFMIVNNNIRNNIGSKQLNTSGIIDQNNTATHSSMGQTASNQFGIQPRNFDHQLKNR